MTDRNPIICMPVLYQTNWADKLEGNISNKSEILVEVDGQVDYKLG